jgi:hypothetical protein
MLMGFFTVRTTCRGSRRRWQYHGFSKVPVFVAKTIKSRSNPKELLAAVMGKASLEGVKPARFEVDARRTRLPDETLEAVRRGVLVVGQLLGDIHSGTALTNSFGPNRAPPVWAQ